MYNERGDLYFDDKKYKEALKDYQKVISYIEDNQLSAPSDFLKGICGSLFCYQCLDDDQSAKDTFNKLVSVVYELGDGIERVDWFQNGPVYPSY